MNTATTAVPSGATPPGVAPPPRPDRVPLRKQLTGFLFVSPWVVFFFGIFAFPLGFAVWMSFYDYFFAAPGADVDRPFVGFDNYTDALGDEDVHQSFRNIIVFLVINVPLTVVLAVDPGGGPERGDPVPFVLPHRLLPALRHGERRHDRGVALAVQRQRTGQHAPRAAGARPDVVDQRAAGDALDCHLRHVEAARHLCPALSGRPAERPQGAVRGGSVDGGGRWSSFRIRHLARSQAGHHAGAPTGDHHRLQPVHRALSAHRRRRAERSVSLAGADHVPDRNRAGRRRSRRRRSA